MLGLAAAGTVAFGGAEPAVTFPRDHFGHPQARIEWWYFTALVSDSAGTPYSVFFTLFSSQGGLVPVSQVTNLESGKVVGHTENLAVGGVGTAGIDVKAGSARLRYRTRSNRWQFSVSTPTYALSLDQRPLKPYALHGGGTGVIRQGPAGTSHYYSSTRMTAVGMLRLGGRAVRIRGQSWFDHQWGDYRDDTRAFNWDWFSCRFDDDTELMLYQFLRPGTETPLAAYRQGTYVAREGRTTAIGSFDAFAAGNPLRAAGHDWPRSWRLEIPSRHLQETVTSVLPDQLVRNTLVPTFWEGAADATGTKHGRCMVEISYR
jgi:predicted secreted hydrolase